MKKLSVILVVFVLLAFSLAISGCGSQADAPAAQTAQEQSLPDLLAKAKTIAGYSYDFTMSGDENGPQMSGKMWISAGKKMKSEITMQGMQMVNIIDMENNVMYNCDLNRKIAMKMKLNPDKKLNSPDQVAKGVDATKAKILESVDYEGVKCRVVVYKDEKSGIESKMWLREDYGVPMKVESTGPDGKKSVIEYKNMNFGPIADDVFQLPAGMTVTDVGQMNIPTPNQ